jgi:response regulator RpfG family c-di-GMP phosphodiesterase
LSLATPIPGGATVVASAEDSTAIARKGAQVIEQTGVLDDVATIVRRMPDPYRKPHEFRAGEVPLASRIVKVANDYDDLVGGSRDSARCFAALERLRLSTARDHDPLVVEQLSRMVERATLLGV